MTAKAKPRAKAPRTGDWLISSASVPDFRLLLADCTQEHAESVRSTVANDSNCPSDASLEPIASATHPPVKETNLG